MMEELAKADADMFHINMSHVGRRLPHPTVAHICLSVLRCGASPAPRKQAFAPVGLEQSALS
jgi:hypothetical protein